MIVVAQRVGEARVKVDDEVVGEIGPGLLLLACALAGDETDEVDWLADKLVDLRIFADDEGRSNRSLLDVGGAALVVSQFTLAADWRKGRRPSFVRAAEPRRAAELVERLAVRIEGRGVSVARGRFAAMMRVELVNDGPYTMVLDGSLRGPARRS